MMRILLIYPYCTQASDHRWYPVEPLGVLYLASFLRSDVPNAASRFEIKILDTQMEGPATAVKTARGFRKGMTDDELMKAVSAFSPDIVGITCNYTTNVLDALEIAETIRKASPRAFVVLGGAHATLDHEGLVTLPYIDAVARSEGEVTFKELVLALERRPLTPALSPSDGERGKNSPALSLEGVRGLTFKSGDGVVVNPERELIPDVNQLPIPDRSLLEYGKYLEHSSRHYACTKQKPIATVFSARGCPFRCIFCSTQKVWRNKWRPRSPENVMREIEQLVQYGAREIAFQDDQFMGDCERIKELCRLIIKRNLGITMIAPPGISPALLDRETLVLMRQAGFYRICLSIDVGNKAAQKYVHKPVRLDHMRQVVKWANQAGLWTYATFVIGFPYETREDIEETRRYAYSLKLDHVIFYIAQPHLGSELYDLFVREGWLDVKNVHKHHTPSESLYGTRHLKAEELESLRNSLAGSYMRHHVRDFLNPAYVLREFFPKINTPGRFGYFLKAVRELGGVVLAK